MRARPRRLGQSISVVRQSHACQCLDLDVDVDEHEHVPIHGRDILALVSGNHTCSVSCVTQIFGRARQRKHGRVKIDTNKSGCPAQCRIGFGEQILVTQFQMIHPPNSLPAARAASTPSALREACPYPKPC